MRLMTMQNRQESRKERNEKRLQKKKKNLMNIHKTSLLYLAEKKESLV